MKLRTIDAAAKYFQEIDPDSAVTAYAIRQAVKTGAVPYTRAGAKYLLSIENLELYFSGQAAPAVEPDAQCGKIRAIV